LSAVFVEHLVKRFGSVTAVNDIGFEIPAGQVTALLGPNGAGKTTTIEILEGFLPAGSGTVRVLGADPWHASRAWRARIGLVLQSTSLDTQLTVGEALRLYGRLYPRSRPVAEVLEIIGLTGEERKRIGALSGGQQRRVDLGLGIIGRPELLFLDEPTTALDPEARRRLWTAVESLADSGTTVLLTTHYMEEAEHLADRVIVLAKGRIVADSTPERLRASGSAGIIRYRPPQGAPVLDLPLAFDGEELSLRTSDVTGTLDALVGWALKHDVDLTGLEVGPPTLEEAYLALIGDDDDAR
jgi:ABC-2 type transport system ATP-binding protein